MKKIGKNLKGTCFVVGFTFLFGNAQAQLTPKPLPPLLGLGVDNTALSLGALDLNLYGSSNTALGFYAGYYNSASFNTFVVDSAGYNNLKGRYNTYLGYESGISNKSLSNQIYLGDSAGAAAPVAVKFAGALEPYYSSNYQTGATGQVLTSQGAGHTPQWTTIIGGGNDWLLTGNAGTSPAHNFLGTTDTATLIFKVNSKQAGWIDWGGGTKQYNNTFYGYTSGNFITTGKQNTGIGNAAQNSTTSGSWNTANGYSALTNNTSGSSNTAVGSSAGLNSNGSFNTFLGDSAGVNNTTGTDNTYIGYQNGATYNPSTGVNNTSVGYESLVQVTSGSQNTAIGEGVMDNNTTGTYNTALGAAALYANVTGNNNTAIGTSLITATTASSQTAVGMNTLNFSNGSWNTAIGDSAGYNNSTGFDNFFGGYAAGLSTTTGIGNTELGVGSAKNLAVGSCNTYVGDSSGHQVLIGSFNAFLGYNTEINGNGSFNTVIGSNAIINGTYNNSTAIGYGATVPSSNMVVIGNRNVTQLGFNGALEPYYSANYQPGTSGQVLTSQGAGVAPQWESTSATAWSLTGNSGTTPDTNYLGTNDASALEFKVDGQKAGWIDYSGPYNTTLGFEAGNSISTGYNNVAAGYQVLRSNTTGIDNTGVGNYALRENLTGSSNIAIGNGAGVVQQGSQNVLIGDSAGWDNPGNDNTFVGYEASRNSFFTYPSNATAIGYLAHVSASNQVVLGNTSVTSFVFNGDLEAGVGNYGTSGQVLISQGAGVAPQWSSFVGFNYLNDTIGGSGTTAKLATATTAWSLIGNAGTSPATNFLGTTDTATLVFKVNNVQAGWTDIGKYKNVFFGYGTGIANSTGGSNTGIGFTALAFNTKGVYNTGIGSNALGYSITGSDNTAIGANAGVAQDGSQNVLIGDSTGFDNPGSQNTFVGYEANRNSSFYSYSNATAIGYHAIASANNSAVIGNTSVTSIGGYAAWSTLSDSRYKKNIQTEEHGLDFILKLKPVVYNMDVHKLNASLGITDNNEQVIQEKEAINYSGFLAQDVEQAANDVDYDFSGVIKPQNETDHYKIAYSDFVVPLVKSVQELNAKNDSLHSTIDSLRNAFKNIQNCLTQLCVTNHTIGNISDGNTNANVQDITLSSNNAPVLYQNIPNPFSTGGTKINYYLPEGTAGATVVFYDNYGNKIKEVQLSQTGNGTLNVTPDNLSNGIYSYSLIVNDNVIDTKRMALQK